MDKFSKLVKKRHSVAKQQPGATLTQTSFSTGSHMTSMGNESSYPRPDFERTALHWESLNGPWDFLFDDEDIGLTHGWQVTGLPSHASSGGSGKPHAKRAIQVPFVFQAPASGINDRGVHQVLWYERRIEDIRTREEKDEAYRLLLRCGAIDYHATVWLDGQLVGEHRGGHVPFDLDLTNSLRQLASGSARLTIRVFDSAFDLLQPRGKQYWGPKPESIFYTPSSGIWQSVWLESVPPARIADSSHGTNLRSTDIGNGILNCRIHVIGRRIGQGCALEIESHFAGIKLNTEKRDLVKEHDFAECDLHMRLNEDQMNRLPEEVKQRAPRDNNVAWRYNVALWSPEYPLLYDLIIRLVDPAGRTLDEIKTTTGMRSVSWTTGDGTFRLNNRPYFQALLLDQGYWPESLMTPPSSEACKIDIELSKAMGFNGCRKHQKVEDPLFLYWADRLGFLVWGEMASCWDFSYDAVTRFNDEWSAMVQRDRCHPCVVAWTPANESWGYPDLTHNAHHRAHLRALYHATKTLDPSRPINDNCGWEHVMTDLTTFHDYADADGMAKRTATIDAVVNGGRQVFVPPIFDQRGAVLDPGSAHRAGAPILCTEFGGVNIASSNDHSRNDNWGYTTASDGQDLLRRVRDIVMGTVRSGLCCGIVWTQFTDIEQEQNGLYTFDRKEKLPAAEVKKIMEDAARAYHDKRNEL